ncbi:hypothetical protein HRW23_33450 [Streptomyces lunaelactis]|uniref:hypothetical protein n=1 Tax=Streptomyces lunaelactis TaxID=1535768 RepID=UPI00158531A9|nr:hypothetical protein [Streptomyces lunaelactis]
MTKKNDLASGTKAAVQRRAGMKAGKKPKTLNQSAEVREVSSQSGRRVPRPGEAREEQPRPVSRGRLLARITGAVTTGVQLMPDTEDLHSGLLLASLVLLGIDVLIDVGMSAIDASGRLWRVLRTLRASMRRDSDGSVIATVRVGAPSVRRGNGLRLTGRVVSSLLIVGSTAMDGWQHELLVAALTTLVVDVVSESFALLSGYLRTRQG